MAASCGGFAANIKVEANLSWRGRSSRISSAIRYQVFDQLPRIAGGESGQTSSGLRFNTERHEPVLRTFVTSRTRVLK